MAKIIGIERSKDSQYSYNEETRHTYKSMVAVMFIGVPCEELPSTTKYWHIVAEYFTHE